MVLIFCETGQQVNTALNFSIAQASAAQTSITGINANANLGSVVATGATVNQITGLLANTFIGTYSIAAGGAITIVTPGFDLKVDLGNIATGTANIIDITGQEIKFFF